MFDMKRFKQPEAADRIHPFWFWNGEMDDGQIQFQIDEMADKGLGGVFICARQGLKIPYLSEAWFHKVRVAVVACKQRGLNVWLYDEYPYPSGIAGGEVTLEHPDAKHYTLVHTERSVVGGEHISVELPWARILYAKAVPVNGDGRRLWNEAVPIRDFIGNYQADPVFQKTGLTAYNQKRFFTYRTLQKLDWTAPPGRWEVMVIQEQEIEDFKYYGTFVDPCNREAMATFIRLTHDKYAKHLGEFFGATIKGMFTDEIGLLGRIPWSPQLAAFFQERNGYDLLEHLHALIDPVAEGAARIRYDYYQAVHLLLRESYHKQVHDWCEEHGLEYVAEVPSVRHTTQLFSHVPAGDTAHEKLGKPLEWILNHRAYEFRSSAKMVSSLGRQLGRQRNLIECFHSVGWSMTMQDARWMIDRMAAQGTNFFNFHAFFYTVDGLVQHDAPPSQFLQNPYWKHFRKLGDYTGRISYVMSSGEAVISTAVLEPTTSLWTRMGNPFHGFSHGGMESEEKAQLESLRHWWVRIFYRLSYVGRDFDHLDPELLAEAEISNGTIKLGNARYTTLIMPPMTNLESGAWSKIQEFLGQGGHVISMGQLPYEAIESTEASLLEVAQAFGLDGRVKADFWRKTTNEVTSNEVVLNEMALNEVTNKDGLDISVGKSMYWQKHGYKGKENAYYLPFPAASEEQQVLEALTELLDELEPMPVRLQPACGEWGIMLQTRLVADNKAFVFISNQEAASREVELRIEAHLWEGQVPPVGEGSLQTNAYSLQFRELSLESGDAVKLAEDNLNSGEPKGLSLKLAPYASRLIEIVRVPAAAVVPVIAAGVELPKEQELPSQPAFLRSEPWRWQLETSGLWEMKAEQDNAVRFDIFQLRLGNAAASWDSLPLEGSHVGVKTFIDQCADLSASASLPVMMHQTFGTPMEITLAYPMKARYSVEFIVEELPRSISMMMDQGGISGAAFIYINGHEVPRDGFKPVFVYDHMNRSQEITDYIQCGINQLVVDIEIEHDWDGIVDALYFTGPFEVRFDEAGRAVLADSTSTSSTSILLPIAPDRPEPVGPSYSQGSGNDIIGQAPLQAGPYEGFPYYAGVFAFKRSFELAQLPEQSSFELSLDGWDSYFHDCAELLINGTSLGVQTWSPYRWEGQTALLHEGTNQIEIKITNTLIGLLEGKYFDYEQHAVKPIQHRKG
jgi:hypothetical protein